MNFEKLLETPEKKILQFITLIGLIAFVLMTILGGLLVGPPKYNILDYEFAWTASQVHKIFNAWGTSGKQIIAFSIYIDFLYILAYGSLMFGCILIVTRKLEGKIQKIGLVMSILPWIAGICDVVENIHLLLMIYDSAYTSSGSPFIASLFATIKFTIIFICIIFWLIELLVFLVKK